MTIDHSDWGRAALAAEERSEGFLKQWMTWLVIGSAGGIALLLSMSASLGEPQHVLRQLAPSYFSFVASLATAALSFVARARFESRFSEHLASSHNREELQSAARAIPTIFSSPRDISKEMNRTQDHLVERALEHGRRSDSAWKSAVLWKNASRILLTLSAFAFLTAVAWPGIHIARGGSLTSGHCVPNKK